MSTHEPRHAGNTIDSRAARSQEEWRAFGQLPDTALDIIGDVHGELAALEALLDHLGYQPDGHHPQCRLLVFLGDLIDRGPDSPGVVRRVADLVEGGHAMMVMGNHDLNAVAGKLKKENTWLFDHGPVSDAENRVTSERQRRRILEFLRMQPVALHRDDLRVVHACWDGESLKRLECERDPVDALFKYQTRIESSCAGESDEVTRNLALQNQNPMKLVTSGPETRAPKLFFAGGKMRGEARYPWWNDYAESPFVVFGHYWRIPIPEIQKDDKLFSGLPLESALGAGNSTCIDYSVGGRYCDRLEGRFRPPFTGRLAALRWPERVLVFDDGEHRPMAMPTNRNPESIG